MPRSYRSRRGTAVWVRTEALFFGAEALLALRPTEPLSLILRRPSSSETHHPLIEFAAPEEDTATRCLLVVMDLPLCLELSHAFHRYVQVAGRCLDGHPLGEVPDAVEFIIGPLM